MTDFHFHFCIKKKKNGYAKGPGYCDFGASQVALLVKN